MLSLVYSVQMKEDQKQTVVVYAGKSIQRYQFFSERRRRRIVHNTIWEPK